jgi:hypothetical protein
MGSSTLPLADRQGISLYPLCKWGLFFAIGLGGCMITRWQAPAAERAGETKRPALVSFDIAPQPLEAALDIYSSISDVQVLYETSLTSGRRSMRVRGLFTPEAVQSLPGVPAGDANLMAPRGIINFGAAGVRVSGNLNLVAPLILNAFNVTVQGTIMGLPTFTGPSFGTLTTASNVAGAVQAAIPVPTNANNNQASIIIVEVIGYGGQTDEDCRQQDEQRRDTRSYNPNSAVQFVDFGGSGTTGTRSGTE